MKNTTLLSILFAVVIAFAGCKKDEPTPLTKVKMQYNASSIKQSYKPGERFQLDVTVTNGGSALLDKYELYRTYDQSGQSFSIRPGGDQMETFPISPAAKSFTHKIDYVVENKPVGTSIKFFFKYWAGANRNGSEDYIEIFVQP